MTQTEIKNCKCGCGAEVKGNYRPGHDARHLSALYREFVTRMDGLPQYEKLGVLAQLTHKLPTEALQVKFLRRVCNGGYKYFPEAAAGMTGQWFDDQLQGIVRQYIPEHRDADWSTYGSVGILAATGWTASQVGFKFA